MKRSVAKDTEMLELVTWIEGGCLGMKGDLTGNVQEYWGIKGELSVSEGVPLYGERTIIPRSLRHAVITTLHSAHQGMTGEQVFQSIGLKFTMDIQTVRDQCMICNKIAPTQPKLPPVTPVV